MPPKNDDEKLIGRKVQDLIKSSSYSGGMRFTSFLNLREIELAKAELNHQKWNEFSFWGGFLDAERMVLGIFDSSITADDSIKDSFPISAIKIIPLSKEKPLTHRDYLGAILGLGIKRECIGDIIEQEDATIVFVLSSICPFVLEELRQVGRVSVKTSEYKYVEGETKTSFLQKKASVSSLRLDAVLSAMLHLNRTQSANYITKGLVLVNHMQVTSQHYLVCDGDIFSIRGVGKFKLEKVAGKSKKDRTFIEYLCYQ